MQSRKNLRKRNNRNNIYLVIIGLIIVIAIIVGVVIHNNRVTADQKARKFASTHFNPNVSIYGVKVGKLTVAEATAKINKLANNNVQIKHDKVVLSRNPATQTIQKSEVQDYFTKQHTALPNKKNFVYNSQKLKQAKNKLVQINKAIVNYHLDGKTYKLKADSLLDQASYENGQYKIGNTSKLKDKLKQIDHEASTLHRSYKFVVPTGNSANGKTITVTNKTYGWGVYMKHTLPAVEKAFLNGQKNVNGAKYLYGVGFSTYAHGYGKGNHGVGNSYVVVSIKKQELWVVKNGKVVVHLPNVVTGTYTGGKGNRTPTGVWYIMYKQSPSVLRGRNDDGSKYASKVKYWMPFTLSGCGLHDASWRTDWSKTAYLQGGSHGCVNIQPAQIHSVWAHVKTNEAVVIYN